ncbi:MAG: hypothetical protein M3209_14050 [Acidobacteriota bacterium]|nr:hypothetical protein [Acidobacteriota bacterium]
MVRNISDVLESVVDKKDLDQLEAKLTAIEFSLRKLLETQNRRDPLRNAKMKMLAEDVGGLRSIIARLNNRV